MPEPESAPLLLIPGPTPVPQPVLEALARPTESHSSPATAAALRQIQTGLLEAVGGGGPEHLALVLAGSGTLGLEAALTNLLRPGETLLVVNHGYFGDRFSEVGRALGAEVVEVSCPWGQQVEPQRVEEALRESGAQVMTVTHVDTATGVAAPFAAYAEIARQRGAMMVLDSVAGAGGMPVGMADLGIDVVVTASQKALGAPPGLALLALSPAALERRRAIGRAQSYFLDWMRWEPPMRDSSGRYFATLPTNLIAAAAVALALAGSEGWEARFGRHRRMGRAVRQALRALGLEPLAREEVSSATVTAFAVPEGVTPAALRTEVAREGVAIAGGLAGWSNSAGRIGHMGATGLPELLRGAAALEAALARVGQEVEPGRGVSALLAGWGLDPA